MRILHDLHHISIRLKLLLFLLIAVIVPTLFISIVLIRSGQYAYRNESFTIAQGLNESIADDINEFISDISAVLSSITVLPADATIPAQRLNMVMEDLFNRFSELKRITIYNPDGNIINSKGVDPGTWNVPADIQKTAFETAAASGKRYISPVIFSKDKQPYILITERLTKNGSQVQAIVSGVVSLDRISAIINPINNNTVGSAFVVDSKGRVIAYPDIEKSITGTDLSKYKVIREAVSGLPDTGYSRSDIYINPSGERVVASYRMLKPLGWAIIYQQPANIVFGIYNSRFYEAITWTIVLAIIFSILGWYLGISITQPMNVLNRGAEILGSGDLKHRVHLHTGDELERLGNTLNVMAENLDNSRKQLKMEHDRAVISASEARILYRVSQALVSTLDLQTRLNVIAENLASVCHTNRVVIWMIEGNHLKPYASFGLTPEEKELFSKWEVHIEDAMPVTKEALEIKAPVVIDDVLSDNRISKEVADNLQIKSMLALPFIFEDNPIGYAITYRSGEMRKFRKYQLDLAQAVGAQAAVAIENSRVYERVHRIAETLQRSFLPSVPPMVGNFEIADKYSPALKEAEVGGDFYDIIILSPTRIALVIADVSGKGLNAAVYTAMIKYMLRAYSVLDISISEIIEKLNAALYKYLDGKAFITLFYGVLDVEKEDLTYVNAGHELPLLFGENRGICMSLNSTGIALGIISDIEYRTERIQFIPGDVLLMYTDGATDVRRGREFLGMEGLESIFCEAANGRDAHQTIEIVEKEIREFANDVLRDDIALLIVKYLQHERKIEHKLQKD